MITTGEKGNKKSAKASACKTVTVKGFNSKLHESK